MSPPIATAAFILLIAGLFALDRDRRARTSKGLWLAVVWLLIYGSRPVSQWLSVVGFAGTTVRIDSPEQYLEGSPVDRYVYTCLLTIALTIVLARQQELRTFLRKNGPILLFLGYCAISVLWSDYTFVAFKRWTKIVGDLLIVLIVVTDPQPLTALRRLLSRTAFILLPLSVLFIKYYPELGREYNRWTWLPAYSGITETKNELGMLCLILGLASVWRFLEAYRDGKGATRTHQMLAHGIILVMVFWLFYMANSMTSMACFILAAGLMTVTYLTRVGRRPGVAHFLVASIVLAAGLVLFSGGAGGILSSVGRDPTLTGRTGIWDAVLSVSGNPLVGTGFESFWLGDRLRKVWAMTMNGLQEAHNGYLEVYLNLGWIGVSMLGVLMMNGYRNVMAGLRRDQRAGSLNLAFFVAAVIYNFTEAGFRETTLVWIFLLMAVAWPPPPKVHSGLDSPIESAESHSQSDRIVSVWATQENA